MAKRMTAEEAKRVVVARGLETREKAIDARVDQLVAKWGEPEREASRRLVSNLSHALLVNAIAVHDLDAIDNELMAAAYALMTDADRYRIRQGG
jgi:hypothetical protein